MEPKRKFMEKTIKLAEKSAKRGDYAIGAVVAKGDEVIATGTTNLRHENDPTVHGEIVAIRNACKKLENGYLKRCVLYTTQEPCPMCASAAIWAKMKGIVFGNFIEDAPDSWRQIELSCKKVLAKGTPELDLAEGFMRDECSKLYDLVE